MSNTARELEGQVALVTGSAKNIGRAINLALADAGADAKVFEFAIVRGILGDDEQTIQVTEGEVVEFRWSSDRELNLHMHGYDMEVDVAPNSSAIMRVHAIKTGRYPILNHDGEPPNVLLYLEVLPK